MLIWYSSKGTELEDKDFAVLNFVGLFHSLLFPYPFVLIQVTELRETIKRNPKENIKELLNFRLNAEVNEQQHSVVKPIA
jgi:hypothetical protein